MNSKRNVAYYYYYYKNLCSVQMIMQSTSIAPRHTCCYYPVPIHFFSPNHHLQNKKTVSAKFSKKLCINNSFNSSTATNSCSEDQEKNQKRYPRNDPDQENLKLCQEFYSSIENPKAQFRKSEREPESDIDSLLGISSNMWWTDFKAYLGQRINLEGVASSVGLLSKDKHLAIPHVSVPDIRYVDWGELKKRGFKGVVFDKDNTITLPYSLSLWEPLGSSIEKCKSLFGNDIAVFSNSAGVKTPAGTAEEIEKHFGSESSRLIMVGDRPFTDIVYGNRNGFFTILTEPLSLEGEPLIVQQVRSLEVALVRRWSGKGLKTINHSLLPDPGKCVKDLKSLQNELEVVHQHSSLWFIPKFHNSCSFVH
ncbi:hydrolase (HAD superfamily) [Olea europaea subsp. europaea]|uniref:Hydrolase (HAD superfamily) n=1 Tax=Olea europaea subsp. europaea TaxID=158383 RepID=A0A8S0PL52_OLEEU|nr:hydrolase (HAD superfamily) [Olea europaea subsp. europaea]